MNLFEAKTVEKTLEVSHVWQVNHPDIATKTFHKWESDHPRDKWKHSADTTLAGFTTYHVQLIGK